MLVFLVALCHVSTLRRNRDRTKDSEKEKELERKRKIINLFCTNGYFGSDRSMKISRNFERSLTPYILFFSKIKYKHLFYKLEVYS